MDSSIRPIQSQPTPAVVPVHRRREGEPSFSVPENGEEQDAPDKSGDSADQDGGREHDGERPVAPPPDDEAGSHLDITA